MSNKKAQIEESPYSIPKIAAAVLVMVIILAGIGYLIYLALPKGTDCGNDKACFILNANECKSAVFRDDMAPGTTIKYSTKDCMLTRGIEKFNETEPVEVVSFFENKQMACSYTKNNFDATLLDGLSIGMENCEGDLKDAVIELRLAQLSLETP